ncbi:MAG: hypothetical protein A2309_02920 [Bacteroidetes bacterium RIFOXYB2_FULL_35_7]|nr:MAG: hypothetical protein A2309_02920 [Bacteroidetes bacterium RIFOXYB2_FULL_35_7]
MATSPWLMALVSGLKGYQDEQKRKEDTSKALLGELLKQRVGLVDKFTPAQGIQTFSLEKAKEIEEIRKSPFSEQGQLLQGYDPNKAITLSNFEKRYPPASAEIGLGDILSPPSQTAFSADEYLPGMFPKETYLDKSVDPFKEKEFALKEKTAKSLEEYRKQLGAKAMRTGTEKSVSPTTIANTIAGLEVKKSNILKYINANSFQDEEALQPFQDMLDSIEVQLDNLKEQQGLPTQQKVQTKRSFTW